jgi:hypothetical protein
MAASTDARQPKARLYGRQDAGGKLSRHLQIADSPSVDLIEVAKAVDGLMFGRPYPLAFVLPDLLELCRALYAVQPHETGDTSCNA